MLASKNAITQANRTYILNKSFVLQRHTLKLLNVANWLLRMYRHPLLQQSAFYHLPSDVIGAQKSGCQFGLKACMALVSAK